ncbi:MAG: hypothetical protein KGI38_11915 [Thaumarchaeota archaeon]|nr:hypothetical protein [Nitrososphaerota archaeon]
MKFDAFGNRIVPPATAIKREPAYWFEQEQVGERGYCDEPIECESGSSVTHLCSRFDGHGGSCVAVHRGEKGGKKVRRLEYG